MTEYYRINLNYSGENFRFVRNDNYIGIDIDFPGTLSLSFDNFATTKSSFYQQFSRIYKNYHDKKFDTYDLYSLSNLIFDFYKEIKVYDLIITPDSFGNYDVCQVMGNYEFRRDEPIRHSRHVRWYQQKIHREKVGNNLKRVLGGKSSEISNISNRKTQIDILLRKNALQKNNKTIMPTNISIFSSERSLEDFLIENWDQTELGQIYEIYKENGICVGQQFPTDTGPIDLLAISKDKKTFLVVELKKDLASDVVVGQISRYMGFIKEKLAKYDQNVKGVIIANKFNKRLQNALVVNPDIEYLQYEINFKLKKV